MASTTLSQNEVDQLVGDVADEEESFGGASESHMLLYDFRRPHRISKERLRTLEAMYEQLVKTLEGWLIGRVRGGIELKLQSVEQCSFGEFVLSLPTPCASFLLDITPDGGPVGIIDFGQQFASFLVERLFGGSGKPVALDRGLTPIERMAARTIAERISILLEEAWTDHVPLSLELTGFESIPEILLGSNRDDPVLVATVAATAPGMESLLLMALPFTVLEKFFSSSREQRLSAHLTTKHAEDRDVAETMLRSTNVDVAVRLPDFRLPMRSLARLEVGAVLATGIPVDSEVKVLINEQQRFRATAGRSGRRLAARILTDANGSLPVGDSQNQDI